MVVQPIQGASDRSTPFPMPEAPQRVLGRSDLHSSSTRRRAHVCPAVYGTHDSGAAPTCMGDSESGRRVQFARLIGTHSGLTREPRNTDLAEVEHGISDAATHAAHAHPLAQLLETAAHQILHTALRKGECQESCGWFASAESTVGVWEPEFCVVRSVTCYAQSCR
jgi:hypothetical protein